MSGYEIRLIEDVKKLEKLIGKLLMIEKLVFGFLRGKDIAELKVAVESRSCRARQGSDVVM